MANQWYWQHRDELLGPLTTEELDKLIQNNRVTPGDQLRLEESEEWLSADAVKALFAGARADHAASSAEAASKLLKQSRYRGGAFPQARKSGPTLLERLLGPVEAVFSGLIEGVARVFQAIPGSLHGLANHWVTFALIMLLWGSLLLRNVDFHGSDTRRVYGEFSQIVDAVKAHLATNASDSQWQQLRETHLPQIKSSREHLRKLLDRYPINQIGRWLQFDFEKENHYARKSLVQMSDKLEKLLQDGLGNAPRYLSDVEQEIKNVEEVFNGTFLAKIKTAPRQRNQPQPTSSFTIDPLIAGIIVIDVLLLLGGVIYYWRRRAAA